MRLFPDREKLKVVMKKWLPVVFAIAWAPVIWMFLALLLGSWMQHLVGSWWAVVVLVSAVTAAIVLFVVRFFRKMSCRIGDETAN